ncbi:MAG TPA: SUMF1/EgtB/PvdO family nonheme iron enzyme [Steroidobacteraceae bacterium]|nr:SUMF1/EgtB/PvdO family nonheme iron enzyme [Steroidobacteraceae bacterium]
MSKTARPADRKISSSGSLFKKVLQAFANGDLPYSDVRSHLQRLQDSGASSEELREILQRYHSIEPLPAYAYEEILRNLNEAMVRAAASSADPDPARSQPQDAQAASAAPSTVADTRPGERSPEPVAAAAVEARVMPSATVSAVAAGPRPVPARAAVSGAEATASTAENVSSIEDRIARQKADYKALNHAYERVRDAGSAASARTIALAAELAAIRGALDAEQEKVRVADAVLAEERARGSAARRELERVLAELAALKADHATRTASMDSRATAGTLEADLQAARARIAALDAELANTRSALDSAQARIREADEAWAEKLASAEAARQGAEAARRQAEAAHKQAEAAARKESEAAHQQAEAVHDQEAQRNSERHQAELGALRTSLATLRAQLETELQASRAHATTLAAELASTRAALDLEHSKSLETRKALAERVAAEGAAQAEAENALEDALRKSEGYRAELSRARDLLAMRQQEHARIVEALEARRKSLEARLEAAEVRAQVAAAKARAGGEVTVAIDPPRDRGIPRPPDPQLGTLPWESESVATTVRIDARERAPGPPPVAVPQDEPGPIGPTQRSDAWETGSSVPPIAAPREEPGPATPTVRSGARETASSVPLKSRRAAQFTEYPLFGSHGRGRPAVIRFAWVAAALAILGLVVWVSNRHAPVSGNVAAVSAAGPGPEPGSVIRDCPTCPAMTVVPAGRFKQGSNRTDGNAAFERPPHWVLIRRPFALSTNAVTVDEFRPFVAATGRDMRGCETFDDRWRFRPDAGWENPGFTQTGSHPVTCVSWDDAKAYALWLSTTTGHRYRLPSAAEWEYAARAGGEAVRPWDSDGSAACGSANVADQRAARRYPGWAVFPCDDGYVYTAPVGSFKANSFGLNDMLGNVFQWTDDCWHPDYTGVPTDGSPRTYGDCTERELRGGSWFTSPDFVRASYRNHFGVKYRASSVGIRLVRDLTP